MFRRLDEAYLAPGQLVLVLAPGHGGFVRAAVLHGDAVVHPADQRAHVATHAGILDHLEHVDVTLPGAGQDVVTAAAVRFAGAVGQGGQELGLGHFGAFDGLMATVQAGDVA